MNARRLRRSLALPAAERWLAVEALAMLALSRTVLAMLPFRMAIRLLRLRPRHLGGTPASEAAHGSTASTIDRVADAVRRAASVAPFRAVCLQQAVSAALMLRRRGLPTHVYLGVARNKEGGMIAHAWSQCGGRPVTGSAQMPQYQPISVFVT